MSFIGFARTCGLEIADLFPADRIQRCATTTHPRSKNGAFFWDGRRGWVQAWDGDGRVYWYGSDTEWTDADKREWEARRATEVWRRDQRYKKAAERASELLRGAVERKHDYLHFKGFPNAHGLVIEDNALIIPMRDCRTYEITGVQVIKWNMGERMWEKKMLPGMRAKGAVYRIGQPKSKTMILCEGYATGLSIRAAVEQLRVSASVLVCFSDSNMVHVAHQIQGKKVIFADNDRSKAGETAALETRLPYCMAPVVGWDANDWHIEDGLMPVCAALMEVIRLA